MSDAGREPAPANPALDHRFMQLALSLGRRGRGRTWPNPAVGAVVVKDGVVLGRGWTQPGGRPHAETEALKRAGKDAKGATLYVTLEPCSHQGRTTPGSANAASPSRPASARRKRRARTPVTFAGCARVGRRCC